MSSRDRNLKKSTPSDTALPVTSEDDLLGPGDGNSKIGQKTSLRLVKPKIKKSDNLEEENDASKSAFCDVIQSRDDKNFQLHKKDDQIEKLRNRWFASPWRFKNSII